jgi:hypothetical protein
MHAAFSQGLRVFLFFFFKWGVYSVAFGGWVRVIMELRFSRSCCKDFHNVKLGMPWLHLLRCCGYVCVERISSNSVQWMLKMRPRRWIKLRYAYSSIEYLNKGCVGEEAIAS